MLSSMALACALACSGEGGGQGLDPAHGQVQHRLQPGFPFTHQIAVQGTGRDEQQCDEADQGQ
jgi:hypothetical protein